MPYKDPQKKLERARQYRQEQREAISERKRRARAGKLEMIRAYDREYSAKNKERRAEYHQEYRTLDSSKQRRAQLRRKNWNSNPQYRLGLLLRNRLWYALKGKKGNVSTIALLGCSITEAVRHIESQFQDGMSWANHGEWHIDHIEPLASFDLEDEKQLAEACHYTNLRPLWKLDNLRKGARNTAGHAGINAFGDTSSGCALGQGTLRSDSGAAQCRV